MLQYHHNTPNSSLNDIRIWNVAVFHVNGDDGLLEERVSAALFALPLNLFPASIVSHIGAPRHARPDPRQDFINAQAS